MSVIPFSGDPVDLFELLDCLDGYLSGHPQRYRPGDLSLQGIKDAADRIGMGGTIPTFEHEGKWIITGTADQLRQFPDIIRYEFHAGNRVIGKNILAGRYDDKIRVIPLERRNENFIKHELVIRNGGILPDRGIYRKPFSAAAAGLLY